MRVLLIAVLVAALALADADKPFDVLFKVNLASGKNDEFKVRVHPEWAPLGAARFRELVAAGFYNDCRFFRVISGFMAQFGISGDPELNTKWREKKITDDAVAKSNTRGLLSFATSGKNSRTSQVFINFGDNSRLDGMGFAPFAEVLGDGMKVVDQLHAGYGEGAPSGRGPAQGRIQSEGNTYLKKHFPNLSYITALELQEGDAEL
mmetsp:Transcript_20284/g.43913  ORF Transcript_20284/g.43913 Transcript_20284/m.43913 type:complete len:206 (-) Transcript_20284:35-652(-)